MDNPVLKKIVIQDIELVIKSVIQVISEIPVQLSEI